MKKIFRITFLAVFPLLAFAACLYAFMEQPNPHANTAASRTSEHGVYVVSYVPDANVIPKRKLHHWTFQVRTADGQAVDGASLQIDGGMPEHGHGLPTQPKVSQALGGGKYVVEGMKFSMGGYWVIDVHVAAGQSEDTAHFELNL